MQIPLPNRVYKNMQHCKVLTLVKHTFYLSISQPYLWRVETETCHGRFFKHKNTCYCSYMYCATYNKCMHEKNILRRDHFLLSSSISWATNVVEANKHKATTIYGRLELNPERKNLIYPDT